MGVRAKVRGEQAPAVRFEGDWEEGGSEFGSVSEWGGSVESQLDTPVLVLSALFALMCGMLVREAFSGRRSRRSMRSW